MWQEREREEIRPKSNPIQVQGACIHPSTYKNALSSTSKVAQHQHLNQPPQRGNKGAHPQESGVVQRGEAETRDGGREESEEEAHCDEEGWSQEGESGMSAEKDGEAEETQEGEDDAVED